LLQYEEDDFHSRKKEQTKKCDYVPYSVKNTILLSLSGFRKFEGFFVNLMTVLRSKRKVNEIAEV